MSLRSIGLRLAISAVPLCACAAVLGIDDGHSRAAGDGGAADAANTLEDAGFVYADAAGLGDTSLGQTLEPDGSSPVPTSCDQSVSLDTVHGVFVALTGDDTAACTQASPCKTVQQGIQHAHNSGLPNATVYVQEGTYVGALTLRPGVTIIGGWDSSWARLCDQSVTKIQAPPGMATTVQATSFSGSASLSTLTIWSEPEVAVAPGETVVGLMVTGQSTTVNLAYVDIAVVGGGSGAPGPEGDAGSLPAGPCDAPEDGGTPSAPGSKGTGADAGTFVASGSYVVATASAGAPGAAGNNGGPGGPGQCIECVNCGGVAVCGASDAGIECGGAGAPGCGGLGGNGGAGGGSGGSSVAVLVIDGTVKLTSCALSAGGGGNGGPGGLGGGGAPGATTGATGSAGTSCNTTCPVSLPCSASGFKTPNGGTPGGAGGGGAPGGPGGDGAGGDSYAIVSIGNASTQIDAVTQGLLGYSSPGASPDGGNGAPGTAGAVLNP